MWLLVGCIIDALRRRAKRNITISLFEAVERSEQQQLISSVMMWHLHLLDLAYRGCSRQQMGHYRLEPNFLLPTWLCPEHIGCEPPVDQIHQDRNLVTLSTPAGHLARRYSGPPSTKGGHWAGVLLMTCVLLLIELCSACAGCSAETPGAAV